MFSSTSIINRPITGLLMELSSKSQKATCIFMGAALIDAIAQVSPSFLEENGLEPNATYHCNREPHLYAVMEKFLLKYETVMSRRPGGSALNSALWYNQVFKDCQGESGNSSSLIPPLLAGFVGEDDQLDLLKQYVDSVDLDALWIYNRKSETGRCNVMITDQNRCLVSLGGADDVMPENLLCNDALINSLGSARCLYLVSFVLLHPDYWAFCKLAEIAKSWKVEVVFNLSSGRMFKTLAMRERMWEIMKHCDYLIGNENEFRAFTEETGCCETAILKAWIYCNEHRKGDLMSVVMTRASESTLVVCNGFVEEFPVDACDEKDILDTNGAGDAFAAGFLFGLAHAKDLESSVLLGHQTAMRCITSPKPSLV